MFLLITVKLCVISKGFYTPAQISSLNTSPPHPGIITESQRVCQELNEAWVNQIRENFGRLKQIRLDNPALAPREFICEIK